MQPLHSEMSEMVSGYGTGGSGAESPPSSITTPSTPSSLADDDDRITESEYGDGQVTWPWMEFISEHGDLVFVDSSMEDYALHNNSSVSTVTEGGEAVVGGGGGETKEGGIQRRLRNVMKRNESKRNSFKSSGISNPSSGASVKSQSSSSSLKSSLQEFFQRSLDKGSSQPSAPPGEKNVKVETVAGGTKLISRNIILQLGETVEEDFINLENVLGIISGLELNSIVDSTTSTCHKNPNAIVVQGIIPNSPTGKCRDIFIDDTVVAINGAEVDAKNIRKILKQVNGTSEVVVKIERMWTSETVDGGGGGGGDAKSELCSLVCNEVWEGREMLFQARGEMCAIMYLTLNSNEEEPDSDILFWYPESPLVEKLKGIQTQIFELNYFTE